MNAIEMATALVQFLFQRPLSEAEAEAVEAPQFSIDDFRIELLLSENGRARWPQLLEQFGRFVDKATAKEHEPHRIAHDIALLRADLVGLQKRLDGLQSTFIETLRAVDKVKEYFGDVRSIQDQMRKMTVRIERLDAAVVKFAR